MPFSTSVFAISLFLIAAFFALKEYEAYRERQNFVTRFLHAHSPKAEAKWVAMRKKSVVVLDRLSKNIEKKTGKFTKQASVTFRYVVVLAADMMIKTVEGERLLRMRRSSGAKTVSKVRRKPVARRTKKAEEAVLEEPKPTKEPEPILSVTMTIDEPVEESETTSPLTVV